MPEASDLFAFIGSYAEPERPGIHVVAIGADGGAERRGGLPGVANPSFLLAHPGGRNLYAVSETSSVHGGPPGTVHAFDIEWTEAGPHLTERNRRPTRGESPCNLGIDAEGRWLAVANYGSGDVTVLPVEADGGIGTPSSTVRHEGSGLHRSRQESPHPHSVAFAPRGDFALVADLGTDELVIYGFDRASGRLERHGAVESQPGAGPRLVRFHPDGDRLCVVNELDNTISLATWDADRGCVEVVQTASTLPRGFHADNVAAGLVFGAGSVFVSNRGQDAIACFELSVDRGLGAVDWTPSGGAWPRAIETTPNGGHLVVANEHSDTVSVLDPFRDGPPTGAVAIPRPSAIAFARDRHSIPDS